MFPNNTQTKTDNSQEGNSNKSLDIFTSQIVMNIMDQISEINTNSSPNNTQDVGSNISAK